MEIGSVTWLSVKDVTKLKNMYGCPGDKNVTLYLFYPVIYLFRFISVYIRLKGHAVFKGVQFLLHTINIVYTIMGITGKNSA